LENGLKIAGGFLATADNQVANQPSPPDNLRDLGQDNDSKKLSQKINMEAYQAYYNTNDSCQANGNQNAAGGAKQNIYDEQQDNAHVVGNHDGSLKQHQ